MNPKKTVLSLVAVLAPVAGLVVALGAGTASPALASRNDAPRPVPSASKADARPVASSPTASTSSRPQFRLDDTDARRTALVNAWNRCVLDHGAIPGVSRDQPAAEGPGTSDRIAVADPVPASAREACRDVLPLMPPETEAATNPDFAAESRAYVACMAADGLHVRLLNHDNLDWTYLAGYPAPKNSDRIDHSCLLESFEK